VIAILLAQIRPVSVRADGDKAPVPGEAAQGKALAVIGEVYEQDYKTAKTPADQAGLARKMIDQAGRTSDPAARFVLLRVARDIASQAGNAETALSAVDEIARSYDVDATAMNVDTLLKAARNAKLPEQRKAAVEHAIPLVRAAAAADDYERARRLVDTALASARRLRGELLKEVVDLRKQIVEAEEAYTEVAKTLAILEEKPTDPDANLAAGKYYCLVKGDWDRGIPMLALGSDERMRTLAQKELKGTDSPDAQVELGDAWWDLAEREEGAERRAFQGRAAYWYEAALPTLTGLDRAKVEKRVQAVAEGARSPSGGIRAVVQPGNVALASNGTTVSGPSGGASHLFDGITGAQAGRRTRQYTEADWPCEWIITFEKPYRLREIRFQLFDRDKRFYRYALETSPDGKRYVPLVDRREGKWFGWQRIQFPSRPVKSVKLIGSYNSLTEGFHVFEFEAYCIPPKGPRG
jgi:hypothetical protein